MATNFLATAGTNGFLTSAAVQVFGASAGSSTVINGLTNTSFLLSTAVFTQTNTAQGLMGYVTVTVGSSFVSGSGGNITGWWNQSWDGGTTYETTVPSRPPDFVVSFTTSTSTAGGTPSSGPTGGVYPTSLVGMPWGTFKVLVQNNTGVTLGTSGISMAFQSVAEQY